MWDAIALFDQMSELMYLCDTDTYELLYLNPAGKKAFGIDRVCGQKCYQALQGLDAPCPFCTNSFLNHESFYTWEITNAVTKRHYMLKDKLMEFDGRECRLEIAFDMTEKAAQEMALKNSLDAENLVLDCVRELHISENIRETMGSVLAKLGEFLQAERAYLFEISGEKMNNTYEWCASEVQPEIESLQGLSVELLDRWRPQFNLHQCVVIEDLEKIREENPEEYRVLGAQGIYRLVAAPLELDGILVGYIGVDNPPMDKVMNISSLLDTLGYFLESSLRRERDKVELERLSYYDTLTGALNRNAFMRDTAPDASRAVRNVGVVYLDINGMKELNDQKGHLYGDQYLMRTVENIRSVFPKQKVYRIGGDEFLVICTLREESFLRRVREIKKLFSGGNDCSASVGCHWTEECADLQKLLYRADEAMYLDKKNFYRSRVFSRRYRHGYDDILGLTRPGVLQSMIEAGRFRLCFQPKVSIRDGSLVGAEALVRYQPVDGSELTSDQFVPVLEEARMMAPVDFFVFERVCSLANRWYRGGEAQTPVSVNFSRYTLTEKDFVQRVSRLQEKYGVSPAQLKIEVTESVEEDNRTAFIQVVEALRRQGFLVSIDDFGVRHANLSLFSACDFDELKLDRSLVMDLENNRKARAIVQSTIDICRTMEIELIAEGVETQRQAEILLDLGCDRAQGFLYSRPLVPEEFEQKYCAVLA